MNISNEEKVPKFPINSEGCKMQWSEMYFNDEDNCSFVFKINAFSLLNKRHKEFIESPLFSMEQNENIKWNLQLYPEGFKESDNISLYLKRNFIEPSELKAKVLFSIINKDNEKVESFQFVGTFNETTKIWGTESFIKNEDFLSKKEELLPNDTLTIFCSVLVQKQHVMSDLKTSNKLEDKILKLELETTETCYDTYEKLFLDDTFCDITFTIDGKEIKAHKCLLAAASPVFESILKGSQINSIEVSDLSHNIMIIMLKFIYTKKVDDIHDIAHELIFAANKYNIQDLKKICEKSLCQIMNIDNVLKVVSIADENNANILKELAIDLIIKNKMELTQRPEFKELIESYPSLKDEIFWSFMLQHDSYK